MIDIPFEQAAMLLPAGLRTSVLTLDKAVREQAEEFRLRTGHMLSVVTNQGELEVSCGDVVQAKDLHTVLELATQSSVHTALERVRSGFVTVQGGHRVGLCGTAVVERGEIVRLRQLSSLNIRIAHELKGISNQAVPELFQDGQLQNTLILAPPGAGKTTLLRDLIRCISDGDGVPCLRIGVADERGELAALWNGIPQMDLGRCTDVLDGAPKSKSLLLLLRGMNPQVLAADEITDPNDIEAMNQAAGCGVSLLATAHGSNLESLYIRPVYRELLHQNIFQKVLLIQRGSNGDRSFHVEDLPCRE